MAVNCSYLRKP